ncbi:MAG: hypothetical protein ACJ79R_20460, partial [Anaeromyxobacteraceae bacterium]
MRNRILLLGLALAPSLAAAQVTVTETSTGSTGFINIAECENSTPDGLTFTWTFPGTLVAGGTYTLTASTKDQCPTDVNQGAKNVTVAANIAATSLSGSHPTSGSVGVQSLLQQLGLQCTGPATAVFFCVTLSGSALTTQATGSITLDLGKP